MTDKLISWLLICETSLSMQNTMQLALRCFLSYRIMSAVCMYTYWSCILHVTQREFTSNCETSLLHACKWSVISIFCINSLIESIVQALTTTRESGADTVDALSWRSCASSNGVRCENLAGCWFGRDGTLEAKVVSQPTRGITEEAWLSTLLEQQGAKWLSVSADAWRISHVWDFCRSPEANSRVWSPLH